MKVRLPVLSVTGASMSVVPVLPFQVIALLPAKFTGDERVHSLDEALVIALPPARLIVPPLMPVVLTNSEER